MSETLVNAWSSPVCKISKKSFDLVHGYVPKGPRVEATDKTHIKIIGLPGLDIFNKLPGLVAFWQNG